MKKFCGFLMAVAVVALACVMNSCKDVTISTYGFYGSFGTQGAPVIEYINDWFDLSGKFAETADDRWAIMGKVAESDIKATKVFVDACKELEKDYTQVEIPDVRNVEEWLKGKDVVLYRMPEGQGGTIKIITYRFGTGVVDNN